jgi:signal transduction histidine kinase
VSVLLARLRTLLPQGGLLDERTWRLRHRLLLSVLAAHVPILAFIGLMRGRRPLHVALELIPVITALAVGRWATQRRIAALGVTIGLLLCATVLVHFSAGLIEAHFHYLVMLGLVSLYQDWWVYGIALIAVAANHIFGVFLPQAIYSHPSAIANPVRWGLIHGCFVAAFAIGNTAFWKMTESEQVCSRRYYQKLSETERGVAAQLREAEQLKNELIAVVSHEFRTPLTSILGFAQTLSARLADFDQPSALLCAERIEQQAKRLSRLVHNLLAASGDMQLEPGESIDLREVVEDVIEELADAHLAANLRISAVIPRGLRVAIGADSAHQVVMNLVDNALKFADPGTPIQLRGRRVDDDAVLEVANIGTPIPPEARERIFLPFVQLDSSETRHFDGIGLGLSIVRKLVQSHNGTVDVHSDGRLVVFCVTLPVPSAASDTRPTAPVRSVQAAAR